MVTCGFNTYCENLLDLILNSKSFFFKGPLDLRLYPKSANALPITSGSLKGELYFN